MLAYISKSCARVNPLWQLYGTTLAFCITICRNYLNLQILYFWVWRKNGISAGFYIKTYKDGLA